MIKKKNILSCFIIVIFMLSMLGCGGKKFDLMDILTIEYTGLEGEGKAHIYTKWDEIQSYLENNASDNNAITLANIATLEDSVKYTLDKDSNLSNGDKIKITVTFNKEIAKKMGLNLKASSKTVTVEGLKESSEANLFNDIEVDFTGVSPKAKAEIRNTSSDPFFKSVTYTADPSTGLKKGDTVKVTAKYSESKAEEYGYKVEETTKEFTVDDVDEYISSIDKIDEESMKKIDSQSKDLINAKFAQKDSYYMYIYECLSNPNAKFTSSFGYYSTIDMNSVKINTIDIEKKYLLSLKSGAVSSDFFESKNNKLYMVYKVNVTDNCFPESVTVYVPVYFKNIILRNSGDIDVALNDAKVDKGHDNLDNLYREEVTSDKDKYNCDEK